MSDTNSENYSTDKPIIERELDAFQRYGFSKRIAETIVERKNRDSLVFGIFGVWGEGKSTVLNFINKELESHDEILTLVFNPWRYGDEDTLIKNFLKKVSELLGKELSSNKEKFAGFVGKYGSVGSIIGVDFSEVGKKLADVDLENLKKRVDEFISESGKRLVIFIDDIDRLDKQEIYSLFRLVKLTADFKNTTYILSFDQEMVASAIGERFGTGDKKAGENFLEKIIQVPLTIPKAQSDALKKFCFKLVDNAILNSNINLSEDDAQRFVYQFTTNILSRLTTPRLAVRYGNTLSFSLPLLKGEVNTVDLMLIEALRVFYPDHYSFVKNNPDYFIGSYSETYGHGNNQVKIDSIKKHFENLELNLHEKDKSKVRDLLSNLFPRLDTAFGNYHFGNETYNEWFVQKRIVSTKYFDRYFSYSVIEGDISDIEFDLLLEFIAQTENTDLIVEKVQEIIAKTSKDNFMQKLRSLEKEYEWESAKRIAKVLCDISEELPKQGGMMSMGFETPFGQAAIFILQLLKNHKEKVDLFDFGKELMTYPKQFEFAYEINNWLRSGKQPEEKLFNEDQYADLAKTLTERALEESKDKSIFDCFPVHIGYIGHTWAERNKPEFDKYVDSYLDKDVKNILTLLKSYTPTVRSSSKPHPFKGDLSKDRYEYLVSFYDKDKLFERIQAVFEIKEIQAEDPFWIDYGAHDFTDLNMVRQFHKWYQEEKTKEKE
ncbi:KAP family P-loop NTPase fold protein [Maribacter dokdonensis]|uniref:KAP family P-loop NTPase fold protein n=1 Tax=Maribacter dokdonensis TaxID=320912 RepID=UPI001C0887E4|nr:P-loop NTPase fold protein [Maribacter dokdonensis]MBU2902945.1 KAP family NTPase [Maribacter dokdonensis]